MPNWKNPNDGSWTDPTGWDTGMVPGPGDGNAIATAGSYRVSLSASISTASLAISDAQASLVVVDPGGSEQFTGDLTNNGFFGLDSDGYSNEGGSSAEIGGTLTNTGTVTLGPSNGTLSAPTILTVGALAGAGVLNINGGTGATPSLATLNALSAAPATLAGTTVLSGDALLEFASGSVGAIAANVTLLLNGIGARLADAANTASNSALAGLAEIDGTLRVVNGDTVAITGNVNDTGFLGVDSDGYSNEGGSAVTIAGTLTNAGQIDVGPFSSGLSANSTLTVGGLAGTGAINIHGSYGATPSLATLSVLSAAPGTLAANTTIDGDGLLDYASGQIGTLAANTTLLLNGPRAFVADAGNTMANSAIAGLAEIDGTLRVVNGDTVAISGNVNETGFLGVDSDGYSSEGGSAVTIAGTLTNTGQIDVGPGTNGLSANATLTVGGLTGAGGVGVHGSYGAIPLLATLNVLSAAPGTLAANTTIDGDGLVEYASGQIGTLAAKTTLLLNGANARVADAANTASNSALAGLAEIGGTLRVVNGDTVAMTGNVSDTGFLGVDSDGYSSEGGSAVTIAGTLTNTGQIDVGPGTNGLSANATLTVGGLAGTGGVGVHGSYGATPSLATLNVLSAAPGTLAASTTIDGDGLVEYASGQIGTLAANTTLLLNGANARVADAANTASNSALAGLAEIDGTLRVVNGDTVAITGNVNDTGFLGVDSDGFSSEGGSTVTIAGTLTNTGQVAVGSGTNGLSANATLTVGGLAGTGGVGVHGSYGATPSLATLNVLSAAPGTLAANTTIDGDALLDYASGQIGTLAANTTLLLNGPNARIADAANTASDSAIAALAEIDGTLRVLNGNTVALAGNVTETGFLDVDGDGFTSEGGSAVTIAGTLTNTGQIVVGPGTNGLSANTTLTVGGLAGNGSIGIHGSYGASPFQATVDVLSAAPGTLAANTDIDGDGLLEYASGQIGTIAASATLLLNGVDARIADAADTSSNSAITGLTEIDGTARLINGSVVSTASDLLVTGLLDIDGDGDATEGGSSVTVAGTLTDTGNVTVGPNNGLLTAATTLTVGGLAGAGAVNINGGNGTAPQLATVNVLAAAPASFTNNAMLIGDALLAFTGGQIGTIAANASISLSGNTARVADVGSTTTNSALTGLTEVDGTLRLVFGSAVAVSGGLTLTGTLNLDNDPNRGEGGSSLTLGGALTNSGTVNLGANGYTLPAPTTLSVAALTNTGAINLFGGGFPGTLAVTNAAATSNALTIGSSAVLTAGGAFAESGGTVTVAGQLTAPAVNLTGGTFSLAGGTVTTGAVTVYPAATLNGYGTVQSTINNATTVTASGGTLVITGSVQGGGWLAIASGATLELQSATAEAVALGGSGDTLRLDAPTAFAGPISGLTIGDTLSLKNEAVTSASAVYNSAANTSALTLALAGGGTLTYMLAGNYGGDTFATVQSGSDSLISVIVPAVPVIGTPLPIQFGQLHAGAVASQALSISNGAGTGAPGLDVSVGAQTGGAVGSGSIKQLAQGATDNTDIKVGLNTGVIGALNGSVTLNFASDVSGNPSPLPSQTVSVLGTVYREAAAQFAPAAAYLHVGDPATQALVVTNADPADGYSENLTVRVLGAAGGILAASGTTGQIAPGGSDASSLAITVPTATTGQVSGTIKADVQSVATGADTLGTTDLGSTTIPVTVFVDNYAQAGFGGASAGTLTQTGTNYTLDLGTIAANSGVDTVGFSVSNTAAGPADFLSGTLTSTASSGFSTAGLQAFSGVAAGSADSAPTVTLDTTQTGAQTATITLTPTGSNPSGYSQALPTETLTVKANVVALPPPTITGGTPLTGTAGIAQSVGPLTVSDPNTLTQPLTVTVSDATGILSANASGGGTVSASGTNRLTLSGTAAEIDAALASLTYQSSAVGNDTITVTASDQFRGSASQAIAVTTNPAPLTGIVINSPPAITALVGASSGLGGLSISDPAAAAANVPITLTLTTALGTLGVKNPASGAIITGAGTNTVSLTGTVAQINASLADDGFLNLATSASLIEYLENLSKGVLNNAAVNAINGTVTTSAPIDPDTAVGALVAGPEGKSFALGIALSSFALNSISLYASTGMGPSAQAIAAFLFGLALIATDAHLVEPDGTILDFNPEGEFVFATSTQSGDSFDVQVRLQPLDNSQSASIVTQVAAQLGTDRVTFGLDRSGLVMVNGSAVNLTLNAPDLLSGGELTQVDSQTYKIVWNTGEVLTVTNSGTFLSVSVSGGPNATPGTIVGLATLSAATTAGNDLTLPDGTVLSGPITTAELAQFANAWRVPQSFSLFDYAPGQSTATFTDTTFPQVPITLADLPASVVSAAAAVVAAAGITDLGVAAAAEFDYIASGGDIAFVQADAQLLSGRTTTPETVTPSGAPPVSIGVLPDQGRTMGDGTDPIPVVFDIYLTAAAATDTVVNYAVLNNPGDIGAAAFGTLPSGSVTIAAGQTMAQVTITVPALALGTSPQGQLELGVSSPSGVPVFTSTAKTTVAQPIAGPPPVPVLSSLTRLGTFSEVNSTTYTLNLGDIQYGEPLPAILVGLTNAGPSDADNLGGTFTVAPVDGFTVSGATLPAPLTGGQAYDGLNVALDYTKFGPNSETITYTPTDTNNSGFSTSLAPITLTVSDNVVGPSMVFSQAWGDVHIITYNGLEYDFQEVGEFTLAKSRITGDSFDIQLRLQQWYSNATVSVITQVAVSLGTDRVTFDSTRANVVDVDGVASTLSASNPVITLNGGTLNYISSNVFQVKWTTGEEATITDAGKYLNVSDGIPLSLPNSVGGLQGEDAGQANDFQLPDGTVLPQPLTYDQLHQEYADGWRVSQAASLFDYPAGEGTANFTDRNFPADVVPLSSLPSSMVTGAASLAAAAGITDPGIAQAAEEDYLATGDTSFIASSAAVQQQVASTTIFTPTNIPAPAALAGVSAVAASVPEAASGATNVSFNVFLTAAQSTDTAVNYTVVDGGAGTLGAAAFGGTLPSGTVTVPAGQTSANLTIAVPQNALGASPDETLQVQLLPTASTQIYESTATTTLTNPTPEPGSPAVPVLTDLSHPGALIATSPTAYTLNIGGLSQGQAFTAEQLAVENAAGSSADALNGSFDAPLGSGFTVVGDALRNAPLAGGQSYSGLYVAAATMTLAANTETLVFHPVNTNASGYSQALPAITLTIQDSVTAPANAGLNSPGSILFPNAHVGDVEQQALSISNTAAAPAAGLDVSAIAGGNATASGSITLLAPGSTDASSIIAGEDTSAAGTRQGIVALKAASDGGGGNTEALPETPTVDVFGTVYRLAAPTVAPISETVHVGDLGTAQLAIGNSDPADGYSEALIAALSGESGGISAAAEGATPDIAAGQGNSLSIAFSTAQAATITGSATLSLTSDGAGLDGLGQTALLSQTVPVSVTVDNYAQAAFEASAGVLTTNGTQSTLSLGTVAAGSAPVVVDLGVLNAAAGPADLLSGSLSVAGSPQFSNAGFTSVSNLAAGQDERNEVVTLATGQAGTFSETVTLDPAGSNASGYSGALAPQTLTITGTVAAGQGGNPVVSSPTLTVAENAGATPIGIAAPTEGGLPPSQFTTTITALPTDGTVTLADGVTPVTAGQVLTSAQLTGLDFTPTPGLFGVGSTLTYTVADGNGGSGAGDAVLGIGPAIGAPVLSSPSVTVAPNSTGNPIGIAAPTNPNYAASQLSLTIQSLPTDGSVTLADGSTAVTAGETLTAAQLTGLLFTPSAGQSSVSSSLGYSATDPAGNAANAAATLSIGPGAATLPSAVLTPPASGPTTTKAITNTPTPIVSGTAGSGAAVALTSGGAQVGSAVANASTGAYSTTLTTPLPQGSSQVTATTSSGSAPALSVYEIPSPVAGVSLPDISSIDIGRLFDAGYQLQFVSGTEAAQLVDGTLSVGPDTTEATIQRLYEGLLGRSNDVTGMTFYDQLLQSGASVATVAADILASPEYVALHGAPGAMSDTQFVSSLYQGFLGRPPTASDVSFWTASIAQVGRAAITGDIANSPEAKSNLAPDTAEVWSRNTGGTLIHELYETGLGREVELGSFGLGFWQNLLQTGTTPLQLAQLILSNPEPQALHAGQSDSAFVSSLYQDGLGRAADPAGLAFYTGALQSGSLTRAGVLLSIATSPEAATHLIRDLPSY